MITNVMYASLDQCAVSGCTSSKELNAQSFPKNPHLCNQWKEAIKNPVIDGLDFQTLNTQYFVCAKHFWPGDSRKRPIIPIVNQFAVPSLYLKANEENPREQIPNLSNVIYASTDQCAVPGCIVPRGPGTHPFPRNSYYCNEWKLAIENEMIYGLDSETLNRGHFVCARHFMLDDYKLGSSLQLILKDDAVPNLYLEANEEHPDQ